MKRNTGIVLTMLVGHFMCVTISGVTSQKDIVRDFRCIAHNWKNTYLNCSWNLTRKFIKRGDRVNITWYPDYFNTSVSNCPVQTETFCVWPHYHTDSQDIDYEDSIITITLKIIRPLDSTTMDITYSSSYRYRLWEIVQPEPVINLRTRIAEKNCIKVDFNHAASRQDKMFQIRYTSTRSNKEIIQITHNIHDIEFCEAEYFTKYVVSVECKPSVGGFWSVPVQSSIVTAKHVPSTSPLLFDGSFTITEATKEGKYDVTLYWQSLNETMWNAREHEYYLLLEEFPPLCKLPNQTSAVHTTLLRQSVKVLRNCSYIIKLWASNEVGRSVNFSTFSLEKRTNLPPMPENVLINFITPTDYVNLTWSHQWTNITRFTVYWCLSIARTECKEEVHMKHVTPNNGTLQHSTSLTMKGFPLVQYIYGVSAQAGLNSGFRWTDCSSLEKHMLKPPSLLFWGIPIKETITLNLLFSACNEMFLNLGYNFTYHIKTCETDVCRNGQEQVVTYQKQTINITNVPPGQKRCFIVQVYLGNTTGSPSESKCYIQKEIERGLSTLHKVIIVIGAPAVLLVLIIFVCYCRRLARSRGWCTGQEEPFDIEMPNIARKGLKNGHQNGNANKRFFFHLAQPLLNNRTPRL